MFSPIENKPSVAFGYLKKGECTENSHPSSEVCSPSQGHFLGLTPQLCKHQGDSCFGLIIKESLKHMFSALSDTSGLEDSHGRPLQV